MGTPRVSEGAWLLQSPRENPQRWPPWFQWPPHAPAMESGPAQQGLGSLQVIAIVYTKDQKPGMPSWGGEFELWGTEVAAVTVLSPIV